MKKKPLLLTAYALSIILVVGIILLAVVPVKTYPQINNPTSEIVVKLDKNTNNDLVYTPDNQTYNKLLNEIKKGFRVNILTGLLNGYLSSTEKEQVSNKSEPSTIYVTFNYLKEQTLKVNGKEQTKNSYSIEKVTYKTLSFEISSNNAGSLITVYYTTNDKEPSKYTVKYYGNMSKVYELIEELRP